MRIKMEGENSQKICLVVARGNEWCQNTPKSLSDVCDKKNRHDAK